MARIEKRYPDQNLHLPESLATLSRASARLAAFWGCALLAALRTQEILALAPSELRFDQRIIRVAASWDTDTHRFAALRSTARVREVPLPRLLARLLETHLNELPDDALFVFPSTRSARLPVDPRAMRAAMARVWTNAGLNPIGLYEARSLYARIACAAGIELNQVCAIMGTPTPLAAFGSLPRVPNVDAETAVDKLNDFLDAWH